LFSVWVQTVLVFRHGFKLCLSNCACLSLLPTSTNRTCLD
jgi:hypothetical protein